MKPAAARLPGVVGVGLAAGDRPEPLVPVRLNPRLGAASNAPDAPPPARSLAISLRAGQPAVHSFCGPGAAVDDLRCLDDAQVAPSQIETLLGFLDNSHGISPLGLPPADLEDLPGSAGGRPSNGHQGGMRGVDPEPVNRVKPWVETAPGVKPQLLRRLSKGKLDFG